MSQEQMIMGEPPKEEARRSNKPLVIMLISIAVLVIVGLLFLLQKEKGQKAPQLAATGSNTQSQDQEKPSSTESVVAVPQEPQAAAESVAADATDQTSESIKRESETAEKAVVEATADAEDEAARVTQAQEPAKQPSTESSAVAQPPESIEKPISTEESDQPSASMQSDSQVTEEDTVETAPEKVAAAETVAELPSAQIQEASVQPEISDTEAAPGAKAEDVETPPVIASADSKTSQSSILETQQETKTVQSNVPAPIELDKKSTTWIVSKGDCLWYIAQDPQIFGDPYKWNLIYQANKDKIDNPDLIYPGQKIMIPKN